MGRVVEYSFPPGLVADIEVLPNVTGAADILDNVSGDTDARRRVLSPGYQEAIEEIPLTPPDTYALSIRVHQNGATVTLTPTTPNAELYTIKELDGQPTVVRQPTIDGESIKLELGPSMPVIPILTKLYDEDDENAPLGDGPMPLGVRRCLFWEENVHQAQEAPSDRVIN